MSIQNTSYGACHPITQPRNIEGSLSTFLKRVWKNLTATMKSRQQRRINRQAFQHLLTLEDHILKDIGITRDDVIWASRLPLHQNASQELEKIRRQAKGK